MTDYRQIWDRLIAMLVLPDEDRKTLIEHLHEETRTGIEMLAQLSVAEMSRILKGTTFANTEGYLRAAEPVLSFVALNGYCLYLLNQNINPLTTHLAGNASSAKLGETWAVNYRKDQNKSYVDAIDPIIGLMLNHLVELLTNQLLAMVPDVIELPYKVTERLHQSVGWPVFQGFVLGMMEDQAKDHHE